MRPVRPNGNKARIDAVLKPVKDALGVRMDPFRLPNTKGKAALFGDVYVSASVSNTTRAVEQMRRHHRDGSDRDYRITAHAYAVGTPSERIEMSVESFCHMLLRLIEKDPAHYLRKLDHAKDKDE